MKITKGSKPFRKVLDKIYDFLSPERLGRWERATRDMDIKEENLRRAFKIISCKYLSAKQKDKMQKF